MYLAYMDESGNSGTKSDPNQPIHLLGCLLVEESCIRPFEEAIHAIAVKHFPDKAEEVELKGSELFAGSGAFKALPPDTRIEIAKSVLEATLTHATAWGYTGIIKKRSYANDHPHRICFSLLLEGLQDYLAALEGLGLIVADEYNEISRTIIHDLHRIKTNGTFWGYKRIVATNVVDSVHFVQSRDNRIIQAADLVTYLTLKKKRITDAKIAAWLELAEPRPNWTTWRAESDTRSEKATLALAAMLHKVPTFQSKYWP